MKTASLFFRPGRAIQSAWLTLLLISCLAAGPVSGADKAWIGAGADDLWSTGANWEPAGAPEVGDNLTFDGTVRLTPNNDLAVGTVLGNIAFGASAGSFSIAGNAIVLTNGVSLGQATAISEGNARGGSITTASPNAQTLGLPITFSAGNHNVTTASGAGALNFTGPIGRDVGAGLTFTTGGGDINFSAATGLANVNGILGGWAIIGNNWAVLDGAGNIVPYAGYMDVASGALPNDPTTNVRLINDTGAFTATDNTVNSILGQLTAAGRNVTVTGTMKIGPGGGIYGRNAAATQGLTVTGGTVTVDGGGELNLLTQPFTSVGGGLTFASAVANDGANPVSVNIRGNVAMNGAKTFSGGTFIFQNGRANANNAASLGTGPITIFPGGQYLFSHNNMVANDFFIVGDGTAELNGGQTMGAIRLRSSANNNTSGVSGQITLMDDARISGGSATTNHLNGKITGPGRLELTANTGDSGAIFLSNPGNDWSGGLRLTSAGSASRNVFLKLGASGVIPSGAGKGDVVMNGAVSVVSLDINGFDETINGLASIVSAPGNAVVTNSSTTAATLTLGDNDATATFAGMIRAGTGVINVTKIGAGTQEIVGANSYTGATTVNAGKLVTSTASTGGGNYTVASGATLGVQVASLNGMLAVGNLSLDGTIEIDLAGSAIQIGTFTVMTNTGTRAGAGSIVLGSVPPRASGVSINDDVANNRVTVTVTGFDSSITWVGGTEGQWDVNNAANSIWTANPSNTATHYMEASGEGDAVVFDDAATGLTTVTLAADVAPAGITVNNTAKDYTFTGSGAITGAGGLTKEGEGALTIAGTGVHTFAGGIAIGGGSLVYDRADNLTVANVISGAGTFEKAGMGTLTLSAANTYTGTVTVSGGTLRATSASSFGPVASGQVNVLAGTVDINGVNFGGKPFTVQGAGIDGLGAIVNNGGNQNNALGSLTLTGDATVGGTGRWDIRNSPTTLDLGGFTLTKVGGAQFSLVGVSVSAGHLVANEGVLATETSTSFTGEGTITVNDGGVLGLFRNNAGALTRPIILNGGIIRNGAGSPGNPTILESPITLTADSKMEGSTTNVYPTSFNGVISEPDGMSFGLTKSRAGGLILTAANTYTGTTVIEEGSILLAGDNGSLSSTNIIVQAGTLDASGRTDSTLALMAGQTVNLLGTGAIGGNTIIQIGAGATVDASGRTDETLTVAGGQTLGGAGTVIGDLLIASGATVAPGASIGILSVEGDVVLAGTTVIELTRGQTPNSDRIAATGSITLGGALVVTNAGAALQAGDSFKVLDGVSYSGTFASVELPALAAGLHWDTSLLSVDGTISVVPTGTWIGAGSPDLNWSNPANWVGGVPPAGSALTFTRDSGLASVNDLPAGTVFESITFDSTAGAFILTGNSIILPGARGTASAQNIGGGISNQSAANQTVNLDIVLDSGSHTIQTASGAGTLTLGGVISRNTGATANFNAGGGGIWAPSLTNTHGIVGGWAVFGNADWAANDGEGRMVAYTGYVDVAAGGAIASDPASNIRIATGGAAVTLANEELTEVNTIIFTGGGDQDVNISAAQTLRLGATGGIFRSQTSNNAFRIGPSANSGNLTAAGTGGAEIVFVTPTTAGGNTQNHIIVRAPVTDNGEQPVTVVRVGQAGIQFNDGAANSSYSGGTHVNQGRFQAAVGGAFGSGPVYVHSGGQAFFAGQPYENNFFIKGVGTTEAGGHGALRLGNNTRINGTVTLVDAARITNRGNATSQGTVNGRITGDYHLEIGGYANDAAGSVNLSNPDNDYTGDTILGGNHTLRLHASDVIPSGPGFGDLIFNVHSQSARVATLDLNGFDQTVNGLSRIGTTGTRAIVRNGAAGPSLLVAGDNDATSTFDGLIQNGTGTVSIEKTGEGTVTLAGVSTYTGTTLIGEGTLALAGSGSISGSANIVIAADAVLDVTGLSVVEDAIPTLVLASGQTLSGVGTLAGSLSASAGSAVSPGLSFGTLTVNGDVVLSGTTHIELDKGESGGDVLSVSGSLTYGGTLALEYANTEVPLQLGDIFTLFEATSYSGVFAVIDPATPGGDRAWDASRLGIDGTLGIGLPAHWTGHGPGVAWSNPANWTDGTPVAGASLTFGGTAGLSPDNDLAVGTIFGDLLFTAGAGSFNLGGNGIVLAGDITNESSVNQEISMPITFAGLSAEVTTGNHVVSTSADTTLKLSGTLVREPHASLRFGTTGTINTTFANSAAGILGAWATIGGDWAASDETGNVIPLPPGSYTSFAGETFPEGVTLNTNVRWEGGSGLTIPAGAQMNTFLFTEAGTTARTLTITDTLRFASGGGFFRTADDAAQHNLTGGTVTVGDGSAPAELIIRTRTASAPPTGGPPEALRITSVVADGGAEGPVAVVKTGYGVLRLEGANTFSGGTYHLEGQLRPTVAAAFGTGPVYVADGAQVLMGAAVTFSNDFFIAGIGPLEGAFEGGAIRANSSGATISGTITLIDDARIGSRGGQATTGLGGHYTGRITGGYNLELNVGSGQGGTGLTANMPTITLGSAPDLNDWSGNTTIGRGRVRLGEGGEKIPHGPNAGDVIVFGESGGNSILDLFGATETINGLWDSGNAAVARVASTAAGGVLQVGANDADGNYGGLLEETLTLIKIGAGIQALGGVNTYTGNTLINEGTLALLGGGSIAASPNIIIASGASLDVTGTTSGGLTLASGQTLSGTGTLAGNLNAGAGSTVSPGLSIGRLDVAGDVVLAGTTRVQIENGVTPAIDQLYATGALTLGGVLVIENLNSEAPFQAGNSFKVFNAASYSGEITIEPAVPGPGLEWDLTNLTVSGTIAVIEEVIPANPEVTGIVVSGSNVVFSGTGGVPNGAFSVLASADITLPLSQWQVVATGAFDAEGNFQVTRPIDPEAPVAFFTIVID